MRDICNSIKREKLSPNANPCSHPRSKLSSVLVVEDRKA